MCFSAKVKTPKVETAPMVAPPEPPKEGPQGVQFGADDSASDSKGSSEVSGVSGLKVKSDNSISNEASDSTMKVSGAAKKAVRKSVFNSK